MFNFWATGPWVLGELGETCDQVCYETGRVCSSNKQSSLTTNKLLAKAMDEAGHTCKGFHGPRDYAGTPFSKGKEGEDCGPISKGSKSVCDENRIKGHRPLCYCELGMI